MIKDSFNKTVLDVNIQYFFDESSELIEINYSIFIFVCWAK